MLMRLEAGLGERLAMPALVCIGLELGMRDEHGRVALRKLWATGGAG